MLCAKKMKAMRIITFLSLILLLSCSSKDGHNIKKDTLTSKLNPEGELTTLKVIPRDDSKTNPGIRIFVERLKKALCDKDTSYIFSVFSPKIQLSYQDGDDINNINYLKQLCKNDTFLNDFLSELKRSISLGLIKSEDSWNFPYVCQLSWYTEDPGFTTDLCAIASNVNIYEKPDTNSKIVGYLNYEVVKVDYEKMETFKNKIAGVSYYDLNKNWYYVVKYKEKIEGFVESRNLYSMMGYRGEIKKIDNKYLITSFASGD